MAGETSGRVLLSAEMPAVSDYRVNQSLGQHWLKIQAPGVISGLVG